MTSIYPHCPTASYLSSLTRHFVVGISRMEVIAHARTSSNDRRSHRYDTGISSEYVIDFYCPFGPPPLILSLACDTILIISQEALFCCPHRLHLFHSPQHSWGIRLFIYNSHPTDYNKECPFACKGAEPYPSASGRYDRKMNLKEWKKEQWM